MTAREGELAKSLKAKNQPQLITFVIANAVLVAVVILGFSKVLVIGDVVSKGNLAALGKFLAVPAVLSLITGMIGWAMPRNVKETLVFWKTGKFCLPSCRAFTELGPADPRVDMTRLASRVGALPSAPAEQTALWYRLYRGHGDEPSVEDAHGAYLKFREMTHLSLVFSVVSMVAGGALHAPVRRMSAAVAILVLEYLILMLAARNASNHLVLNVLALEGSVAEVRSTSNFVGKFDNVEQQSDQRSKPS
ncbi:MAG: hypothetical protein M3Y72_27030 [Acidobacteriota bacterium]|nr:hypothetical protein [Acidobacteriota bacterium]